MRAYFGDTYLPEIGYALTIPFQARLRSSPTPETLYWPATYRPTFQKVARPTQCH